MRSDVSKIFVLSLTLAFWCVLVSTSWAFDFSDWDQILKQRVKPGSIRGISLYTVDYGGLKGDEKFEQLLSRLKTANLSSIKQGDPALAFWINVYNILAVKMIVDHHPLDSIRDIGSIFKSVWNRPAGIVGGKEYTLNDVEHEILRKMGEPRIHVAIVCASVSCPDLAMEAYTAESLNQQLERQTALFLGNEKKGLKIDRKQRKIYVSSIFKWFEEDFDAKGGVRAFIGAYLPPKERSFINQKDVSIDYLDYDWGVNEH
ncbi:MAG: DUF547 domain-containing protein [Candidatus Nitrohelix vancouverensis]|uniref:DUF547 domain-containing protein n=1 Tax=Candidatus Nitrohelix vancouverensis TaxID=2705534 RepID=A0A7T0G4N3_9BACT|nr:MAG: DUF547 domain-containing protein [Candidatus Nitrohelix vancouverensis]